MTDTWEPVARETLWRALHATSDDVDAATESVASTVYFDRNLDPGQVERMRQAVTDLEHVTEAYLAAVCEGTEPWADEGERTPSWQPLDGEGRNEQSDGS